MRLRPTSQAKWLGEGGFGALSTRMAIFLGVVFVMIPVPFTKAVGAKGFVRVQLMGLCRDRNVL